MFQAGLLQTCPCVKLQYKKHAIFMWVQIMVSIIIIVQSFDIEGPNEFQQKGDIQVESVNIPGVRRFRSERVLDTVDDKLEQRLKDLVLGLS